MWLLLVWIGCFQWGSRAGRKLPDYTALDKSYEYDGDVIIVGQSGLNVATKLIREITSPFIGIKAAYDILD